MRAVIYSRPFLDRMLRVPQKTLTFFNAPPSPGNDTGIYSSNTKRGKYMKTLTSTNTTTRSHLLRKHASWFRPTPFMPTTTPPDANDARHNGSLVLKAAKGRAVNIALNQGGSQW